MSGNHTRQNDLFECIHDFVVDGANNELTADRWNRFEQLLQESDDACRLYLEYVEASDLLRSVLDTMDNETSQLSGDSALDQPEPVVDSGSGYLGTLWHGAIGFFSQELPFSLLIATVLTGLGLWVASLIYVSRPEQMAERGPSSSSVQPAFDPTLEVVGKITGMADCKWSKDGRAPSGYDNVLVGRQFTLDSGLMEITYDTGAKVILQGPVTYVVESKNGGYLSVGKLTARLEKKVALSPNLSSRSTIHYSLFTIHTPTATVTDLGTEFGVEVNKDGQTNSYVFQGKVLLKTRRQETTTFRETELLAGDSATVKPRGEVTVRHSRSGTVMNSASFIRTIPSAPHSSLIAYWPMNEGRGRGAYDKSGNDINCWFTGEPAWTEGRFGRAVNLAGSDRYLTNVTDPKLSLGTGDFTFSLWFKGSSTNNWRHLLDYNGGGAASDPSLIITTYITDGDINSKLRVSLGKEFTDVHYAAADGAPTLNSATDWYHIAFVRNGTTVAGYVNGIQAYAKTTKVIDLVLSNRMYLGKVPHAQEAFNGALDDVAIWSRALTPAQIKALADGIATPLNVLNFGVPRSDNHANIIPSDGRRDQKKEIIQ